MGARISRLMRDVGQPRLMATARWEGPATLEATGHDLFFVFFHVFLFAFNAFFTFVYISRFNLYIYYKTLYIKHFKMLIMQIKNCV